MGSLSSEEDGSDQQSERRGSYSSSADISESDSCSSFLYRRFDLGDGASSSVPSSPRPLRAGLSFPMPSMLPMSDGKDVVACDEKSDRQVVSLSEVELMKERFAKLLLGEDMSGGGKGVCTALAISNAITNLSATVFGQLWRLEPLAPQKKAMWHREMEWLLCVSDSVVELVPSVQQLPDGSSYEVMTTKPRSDIDMDLPALKKLDAMLLSILDQFCDREFSYVDRGISFGDGDQFEYPSSVSSGRPSVRQEEKWWLPCPKVSPKGLSDDTRKNLQQLRDCTNQIFKAAMAINNNVLAEMEIPSAFLETLPKTGKECLGDDIYHWMTAEPFVPESMFDYLDLSSEYLTLEVVNRIEAALHVWKQKNHLKDEKRNRDKQSLWRSKVKGLVMVPGKSCFLAQRAETLLQLLRVRFPGLSQTLLDMNKIQFNKDVGHSILESYSRVLESLAFNIMARIDDLTYVDDATKQCPAAESISLLNKEQIKKRMAHSPYVSAFPTPTFTPVVGSPGRTSRPMRRYDVKELSELHKVWSYSGNLSSRRISGDAPERD